MIHEDIRIEFTVCGRVYEAVGFIKDGDPERINGKEVLARTKDKNGGAMVGDEVVFLSEHAEQIPLEIWPGHNPDLITGEPDYHDPRGLVCFTTFTFSLYEGRVWRTGWQWISRYCAGFTESYLVVRRVK